MADIVERDRLETAIRRGEEAHQILSHHLIAEAFEYLQKRMFDGWCETKPEDTEARERLFRMFKMSRYFKAFFESVVIEGETAQAELEMLKRASMTDWQLQEMTERYKPEPGAPL